MNSNNSFNVSESEKTCCICRKLILGFGSNPDPLMDSAGQSCCQKCDETYVLSARMSGIGVDDRVMAFVRLVAKLIAKGGAR